MSGESCVQSAIDKMRPAFLRQKVASMKKIAGAAAQY
jgi:hypothetical protein